MNSLTTSLALGTNAVFSLVNGLVLAAIPATVGRWLGVSVDGWLRLFGLSLIAHAGILTWARFTNDRRRWTRINLAVIAPYPLILMGLIAAGVIDGDPGRLLAVGDAGIMAVIGFAHWRALGQHPGANEAVQAAAAD